MDFMYLATVGRRTGRPHVIEIWYATHEGVHYVMSGGRERADWVRNIQANPTVTFRLGGARELSTVGRAPGLARVVGAGPEDDRARRLLAAKYQGWREGTELSDWARTALPVAISPLARR